MCNNFIFIITILIIILFSLYIVLSKMKDGFGPFNLKVYGLTLIIGVGAILSLSQIQIEEKSAFFSILGAIAGYLFGLKNENQ